MDQVSHFQLPLALFLAAILNLDRQSVGQSMLARPLAAGLLVGLASGHSREGLYLGLWTELLWLSQPPLGGFLTPNGGLAVSAALLAWSAASQFWTVPPDKGALVLIFLFIPPAAVLATGLEKMARSVSGRVEARLEESLSQGRRPFFMWSNLKGLLFTLAAGAASLAVFAALLALILSASLRLAPDFLWPLLSRAAPFIPLAGLALNAGRMDRKLAGPYILGLLAGAGYLALRP
ncbi:MAG: PTS sugar transporter subunit IIC [Deltaproteobacteria bacterium]|jgi:mannose/fructose/N-acetylgalactosamine-specific phosphotransferase system component IIC|nr:PTS sugar transporter subunit IIC [Deltaproteobacteria bacterium]